MKTFSEAVNSLLEYYSIGTTPTGQKSYTVSLSGGDATVVVDTSSAGMDILVSIPSGVVKNTVDLIEINSTISHSINKFKAETVNIHYDSPRSNTIFTYLSKDLKQIADRFGYNFDTPPIQTSGYQFTLTRSSYTRF